MVMVPCFAALTGLDLHLSIIGLWKTLSCYLSILWGRTSSVYTSTCHNFLRYYTDYKIYKPWVMLPSGIIGLVRLWNTCNGNIIVNSNVMDIVKWGTVFIFHNPVSVERDLYGTELIFNLTSVIIITIITMIKILVLTWYFNFTCWIYNIFIIIYVYIRVKYFQQECIPIKNSRNFQYSNHWGPKLWGHRLSVSWSPDSCWFFFYSMTDGNEGHWVLRKSAFCHFSSLILTQIMG